MIMVVVTVMMALFKLLFVFVFPGHYLFVAFFVVVDKKKIHVFSSAA